MENISIILELFAFLEKFYPTGADERPCRMSLPAGTTARSVVANLKLPDDIPVLIYVNEKQLAKDKPGLLNDGDTVGVMPVIPGG